MYTVKEPRIPLLPRPIPIVELIEELSADMLAEEAKKSPSTFDDYNYQFDNVCYCPYNIIIDNYEVIKFEREKYIVFDYFILDLQNKKIISKVEDSFTDTIKDIERIEIINEYNYSINECTKREIDINCGEIIIKLDERNRIIGYINNSVEEIGDYFLYYNKELKELSLPKLKKCGLQTNKMVIEYLENKRKVKTIIKRLKKLS